MNRPSSHETDVLVVGAGPTGLVLGLWLIRLGVRVRIIDKTSEPGTTSRALAVQARTLELYDQIGLADAVVERGRKAVAANLWVSGKKEGHIVFGDMGNGLSPFPYAVIRAVAYPFVEQVVRGMHPRARIGFIAVDVVARILDVSFG
jgi:2-polyprenyl-6-methoxyphenol hydroxylase-like FAD-dependent oxidoreductase